MELFFDRYVRETKLAHIVEFEEGDRSTTKALPKSQVDIIARPAGTAPGVVDVAHWLAVEEELEKYSTE